MPRQHTRHSRIVYVFPDDFPRRLERFKEESGLSWAEITRCLGTSPFTLWRWHEAGVRPHYRHLMALLELAEDLCLGHGRQGDQRPAADPGGNIGWTITVTPDSAAAVTVILPVTTDCDADGAVCTADARKLSNRNEFTVSGPTQ